MTTITLAGRKLAYSIIYQKNRKTIKLKFVNPTQLEITAPAGYPRQNIEEMLTRKSAWLIKKLDALTVLEENPVNKTLTDGAKLLYRGEIWTLKIAIAKKISVTLTNDIINVTLTPSTSITKVLLEWYIKNAGIMLQERTRYWAKKIEVNPTRLTIRDQKTRWGSCSTRGSISYNWRIIMAPDEVIDYLIVHELCHMHQPNHSPKFWQLVGRFDPHHEKHRHWLKENGGLLGSIFS